MIPDYSQLFEQLPIPLSFRCLGSDSDGMEYATTTISIFQNGFVMSSPRRLRLGSHLSLTLRVPPEISGSAFQHVHCTGCVKVEQQLDSGKLAYRVEIGSSTEE